jgi:hypothetical protein
VHVGIDATGEGQIVLGVKNLPSLSSLELGGEQNDPSILDANVQTIH